ncbi:MAG: pesticin C-terminus-like muramidase [Acidithiobacillus sp.]
MPKGMTGKEFIKWYEQKNDCILKKHGCKSPKDRVKNSYWENHELNSKHDWKHIDVPCNFHYTPSGSCVPNEACYSGITLSAGVDMGQHNAQSLTNWGITPKSHPSLYKLLEPLLGTGQACQAYENIKKIKPHISTAESKKLISLVFPVYLKRLAMQFKQITGDNFYELPSRTQSAIFDWFYNQGNIYNLIHGKYGKINWQNISNRLYQAGQDNPYSRFTQDANHILEDLVSGALKEYDLCQQK